MSPAQARRPAEAGPTARARVRGSGFARVVGSGFSATFTIVLAAVLAVTAPAALSGPVEVYREGDRYCPRNLPAHAPRIDASEAGSIARKLVPDAFCGPSEFIGGCDLVTENYYDSWRVYVHQYRRVPDTHDWSALTHSYVILDQVGNCIANIPGTEPGARR
ncbi:MAG: hypothetical protein ABI585_14405 [Betaproteobacteria bacterium]